MPSEPYLLRMMEVLSRGLSSLDLEARKKHASFLLSRQLKDGGFAGREDESDLYYTSFAIRGLGLLGELPSSVAERLAGYLKQQIHGRLSVVDLVSWLYSALTLQVFGGINILEGADSGWDDRLAESFESCRAQDGGYAKTQEGSAGSTYQSFLITLGYELIGRSVPEPAKLVQFLYDRQRDDGGFVEIAPMKRSGTNPTAAAVAILDILGYLDQDLAEDVQGFLNDVKSAEGGFQANSRIPFADGLSTFTGVWTARQLRLLDAYDPGHVTRFLCGLEHPKGGFRGATWDHDADVEYTFYALGGLALTLSEPR